MTTSVDGKTKTGHMWGAVLVVAALTVSLGPGTSHAETAGASERKAAIVARYNLSLNRILVGRLGFNADVVGTRYSINGKGEISGLPGLFITFKGRGESTGTLEGQAVTAQSHAIGYNTVKRDYRTAIAFRGGDVTTLELDPPAKVKKSRVPVEPQHKTGVIDPLSALILPVAPASDLTGPGACAHHLHIFDGRERFDVALSYVRTETAKPAGRGGYAGPLMVCRAHYTPLAGHRHDDEWADKVRQQGGVEVKLMPVPSARVLVVHSARLSTPYGRAVLKARRIEITPG